MKKKTNTPTPRAVKPRTRRRGRKVPAGLNLLFQSLQPMEFTGVHGWTTPEAFLDVVDSTTRNSKSLDDAIREACNREYPGRGFGPGGDQAASECPDVVAIAGFWSGVATAWFAMRALQGNGAAR